VVIADDQKLLRAGFSVILEAEPDITVVGEAGDGRAAVDTVLRRRPDVVLMDIRMPHLDGLDAAERILAEPGVDTAVVMLTTFDASEYVYRALRIGASGFLLKDATREALIEAVKDNPRDPLGGLKCPREGKYLSRAERGLIMFLEHVANAGEAQEAEAEMEQDEAAAEAA